MGHGRRMTVIRKTEKNKNKIKRKEREKTFIEKQVARQGSTAGESFWAGMGAAMVCALPSPASFSLSSFSRDSLEIIWSKRLGKRPHPSFDVGFHVWQTTLKGRYWNKKVLLLLRPSSGVNTSKGFPSGTDSVDCFNHPRLQVATLKLVGWQASWDRAAFPHTSVCRWVLSAWV